MESNDFMGIIRSMLHEPRPNAAQIVTAIQTCPDAHTQSIAERYAWEHFQRIQSREQIPEYSDYEVGAMRYNSASHLLSTPDGSVIKKMCCPIAKRWDQLDEIDTQDRARTCPACQRHVYNTQGMDAHEVHQIVKDDPEVCLYIDQRHGNVEFITSPQLTPHEEATRKQEKLAPSKAKTFFARFRGDVPEPPEIRTLLTCIEINQHAALGYFPLVRQNAAPDISGIFIQIWQNSRTGQIVVQTDSRCVPLPRPYREWTIAVPGFHAGQNPALSFVAYMIPLDLEPGTQVSIKKYFTPPGRDRSVLDPIRYDRPRPKEIYATWTGSDVEFERAVNEPDYYTVG